MATKHFCDRCEALMPDCGHTIRWWGSAGRGVLCGECFWGLMEWMGFEHDVDIRTTLPGGFRSTTSKPFFRRKDKT